MCLVNNFAIRESNVHAGFNETLVAIEFDWKNCVPMGTAARDTTLLTHSSHSIALCQCWIKVWLYSLSFCSMRKDALACVHFFKWITIALVPENPGRSDGVLAKQWWGNWRKQKTR